MTKATKRCLVLLPLLLSPFAANADLITSNTIANPITIDFDGQDTVSNIPGPIQIGTGVGENIEVSGDPDTGLYTNFNGWGLVSNGTWGQGMTYISANDARPGSLIFHFNDGPVSAVGGFMNHAPDFDTDLIISVLDEFMNVLEEYNITELADIVTPNGLNEGGFRGIDRGGNQDIHYFVVYGYVPVLDDFTFSRSVPEPGTLALLGLGLFGLGFAKRRKT